MSGKSSCKSQLLGIAVCFAAGLGATVGAAADARSRPEPITMFGAASLTDALTDIGELYRSAGQDVRFAFAASSTLARQIEAGAPAAIFASASSAWMDYLQERQLIDASSRMNLLGNSLVLIAPYDTPAQIIELDNASTLAATLGHRGRLAMGDPAHVPAGIYARQALQNLGLWPSLRTRIAFASDVRGVIALVERGEAPLGIVYATDAAISKRIRVLATLPASAHDPIHYAFALVEGSSDSHAAALLAFMTEPAAVAVFHRYGFVTR
ncbi:MAG: molybdate ABC transporter substrate-binding protein [Gammaproteobacteria bacterium]|nr:molybdate ABC transporter substrate-binding protein [Gammaproteobacteria bacterium]